MLAGRDSLIRLIGRRKRTLSPHLSLLLSQQQTNNNNNNLEAQEEAAVVEATTSSEPEWVSCPVCGASIRGSDFIVNSHLDTCLARGTKRKMSQRTLLQLNFSPISERKTCLGVTDKPREDLRNGDVVGNKECSDPQMTVKSCSFKIDEQNHYLSDGANKCMSNSSTCVDAETQNKVKEDSNSLRMSPQSKRPSNANGAEDGSFIGRIETSIVGRKFHDDVELQEGATFSILRDPENVKDKHAIKVLSADSGCGQMLGYLPRELAKFLSPLIDKHHLRCEGYVISLPQHPLDVVPISIVCQKMVAPEHYDLQNFEFLWDNVQRITEYAKISPNMTKYQQNFHLMLDAVVNNNAHLFLADEKLFLGSFNSLGNDAQRLFIRLYTRKGPWFRMSAISYPEISDLQKAIEELELAGYICAFNSSENILKYNMKEVLEVLTVLEMREIKNSDLSKKAINSARRHELIDSLFTAYENGSCPLLPDMILERVGTCIKISSDADTLLWRVQRLFFLNGEQDLSAFLLSDLGLIKFPEYACSVTHPIFQCRNDLLEYEEAIGVAQIMDEALDENHIEMVTRCIDLSNSRMHSIFKEESPSAGCDSPPVFFSNFSASWVYSKVVSLGVSVFERERRYEDAVRLLNGLLSRITCDSRRGYWTLRVSVDLEHIGRISESLSVAEEGVKDLWVRAGSKMALQKRVLRLGKPPRRWKTPSYANSVKRKIKEVSIIGRPLNCETGSKNLFYGYDGELCGVEQLALQYYAGEGGGWQGVHSESGIWMTIFGILMWDVIFADVPNVFRSRFQVAPLDLRTDDFYITRKNLVECQLKKIQEGMAEEMLISSWESHVGTSCQGVNWDRHSLSDLRAVVSCIGVAAWLLFADT